MIHFFRKIRYNLIANNKSYKYFKYAIGEIVLVVVGILIALSINNWNEERKEIVDFNRILKEIEKSVKLDSIELNIDIRDIQNQLNCLNLLLYNGQSSPDDSISICMAKIMHTHWPDYNTTGIDQLRNSKNISQNNDELMEAIYDYYAYSEYHDDIAPIFFTDQVENLREYLIKEKLSPAGAGVYANMKFDKDEAAAYREALIKSEFRVRLKHLRNNRLHMIEFYQKRMQVKCNRLLEMFREYFP